MTKKWIFFFLTTIGSLSRTIAQNKPDPNFHLYILMGQSNMAGRGPLSDKYTQETNQKVLMLTKDLTWVTAKHPLHFDKPSVAGVGPGLQFGFAMQKTSSSIRIGLVPTAVGGTSIDVWKPGAYDGPTKTHPYDDAVARIKEATKAGRVKGILWLQGETDAANAVPADYLKKLDKMVQSLRTLLNDHQLPVVIGEIGRFQTDFIQFNANVLAKAPSVVENSSLVTSQDLTNIGDNTHFDSPSAETYGKRFAAEMISLQKTIHGTVTSFDEPAPQDGVSLGIDKIYDLTGREIPLENANGKVILVIYKNGQRKIEYTGDR